jgi:hypothetical protein
MARRAYDVGQFLPRDAYLGGAEPLRGEGAKRALAKQNEIIRSAPQMAPTKIHMEVNRPRRVRGASK